MAKKNFVVNVATLAAIALANQTGQSGWVNQADGEPLATQGYITVNFEITDGNGNFAAYVTDAGKTYLQENSPEAAASQASYEEASDDAQPAVSFELEDNVPLPEGGRGRKSGIDVSFPFDTMAVGQSFFVSDEVVPSKSAAKAMSSLVSSKNKKAEKENRPHRYIARKVVENGKSGARVWRNA